VGIKPSVLTLTVTRNRLEGWFQIDIKNPNQIEILENIRFLFFIDYFLHFDDFWGILDGFIFLCIFLLVN
jgi:hypothetical protein